jgi:hypothetical protein
MTAYRDRREAGDYAPPGDGNGVDGMTKAELLDYAAAHGLDVQASMSKADILAAVKKAG